jgi:DNA (cytosine-5)-methyltransferase 1
MFSSTNAPKRRSLIDLFAGCGGVSLGFEQANFLPVFVNELNDDARATYLLNRPHKIGGQPFNKLPQLHSSDVWQLDSTRLEKLESDLKSLVPNICFGEYGSIDVLAGGPPCQGYSGIGHRRSYSVNKVELPSNHLYDKMAQVIEAVRPKIFLFENVRGLLSSRWTSDGEKGEIWEDIFDRYKKLGKKAGYHVRWELVRARDYGVPQNRPRVLMVGIRKDVAEAGAGLLDVGKNTESAYESGFLPRYGKYPTPHLSELFEDLVDPDIEQILKSGDYPKYFATTSYPQRARTDLQQYFRPENLARKSAPLTEHEYSKHAPRIVEKFRAMIETGKIPSQHQTKKFAQKVLPMNWGNQGPTITATSLPDDYVHFVQPRSLSVREWARLQTFPDWYEFAGKRTTGGLRRAGNPREGNFDREVPKYTQIGNAVPVRLAHAVALHFERILDEAGFQPQL